MMWLDRVVSRTEEEIVCTASVASAGVFACGDEVPACVCLEYIAQACAALVGLAALGQEQPIRPGLLFGCRSLELEVDSLQTDDLLEIRVERTATASTAASFTGVVTRGAETIARGQVSVIVDPSMNLRPGQS
jgi:predicted hotdog family 3-hydroxylacyl-ACP dehydratase